MDGPTRRVPLFAPEIFCARDKPKPIKATYNCAFRRQYLNKSKSLIPQSPAKKAET